jgi:hypothetical protein
VPVTLVPLIVLCWLLARRSSPASLPQAVSQIFVTASGTIVITGYAASAIHRLQDPLFWFLAETAAVALLAVAFRGTRARSTDAATTELPSREASWQLLVLRPMLVTLVVTGVLNGIVLLFTAPRNLDGLSYHLARVAYYLQQNSLDYYEANFWAQVVHPRNSAVLTLYSYLASGGNERVASIWQYLAYWTSIAAVFGITRETGGTSRQALFAAALFGLLTQSLMQANAATNDMILTAYAAVAVYSLLLVRREDQARHLAIAAAACGLGLGTKISFALSAVLVGATGVYVLRRTAHPKRAWSTAAVSGVLAALLFVAPSGYLNTIRLFGSPFGPPSARLRHTFENRGWMNRATEGSKNVLRLGVDFISLDGLPRLRAVNRLQSTIRAVPGAILSRAGIDLESPRDAFAQFRYERIASAHEAVAYWGILGIALLWGSVIRAAVSRRSPDRAHLAWMTIAFLVLQAFSSPYDPWRGRYFLTAAVFAAPVAAQWLASRRLAARAYVVVMIAIGCLSALTAVVLRSDCMYVGVTYDGHVRPSVFRVDRIGQMTLSTPHYESALREYEARVGPDAIVAVSLPADSLEYPLFGERLSRTILPVNSCRLGRQPIPSSAQFLLFSDQLESPSSGDVWLGLDWYLRPLQTHR